MSYSPFVSQESHKLITLEKLEKKAKEVTALIRRFDQGHYQQWQNGLRDIKKEVPGEDEETRKEATRDLLLDIGIMDWNFKDGAGKAVPLNQKSLMALDATVSGFLIDEIYLHNPRFWPYLSKIDRKRLGLEEKAKNA